jgi:hypothetical protein
MYVQAVMTAGQRRRASLFNPHTRVSTHGDSELARNILSFPGVSPFSPHAERRSRLAAQPQGLLEINENLI